MEDVWEAFERVVMEVRHRCEVVQVASVAWRVDHLDVGLTM
jgi:hypothetical protein